jgi:hypothetical protein
MPRRCIRICRDNRWLPNCPDMERPDVSLKPSLVSHPHYSLVTLGLYLE